MNDNPFLPDDPVYGRCPKCGGNLAACAANGCPNDIKPLPELERLRTENHFLRSQLATLTAERNQLKDELE